MKVLGVIPARGGSKGIPNKNIKLLMDIPLICYTITSSQKSKLLDSLVVTTDSEKIAQLSKERGARVPFIRPKNLATDKSEAIPTIQHAVIETEKIDGLKYDIVVMLQPTCPFTTPRDIDNAITNIINSGCDSVISVVDVGAHHPFRMKRITDKKELIDLIPEAKENTPRQSLPKIYIRSGDIYAVRRDVLINQNTFKGDKSMALIIPEERAINIDTYRDWALAELYKK